MRIEQVKTRAVVVPLRRPVTTASGTVDRAPLVLIDLVTTDGIVGRAPGQQQLSGGSVMAKRHSAPRWATTMVRAISAVTGPQPATSPGCRSRPSRVDKGAG